MRPALFDKTRLLFFIILIEGYVVLACELLAIRQLIPFVGSGTETISIIISAVLLPLAIGYHAGGRSFRNAFYAARKKGRKRLSVRKILLRNILSSLAVLTVGLSYLFLELFFASLDAAGIHNRLLQTFLYSSLFLVGPVFLLGQTVPLVSNYFSRRKLSEITGKMLFFSTSGSFLGSVFSTIVLMTFIGVHYTVIVTLGLLCLLALLLSRRLFSYEPLLCLCIFCALYAANSTSTLHDLGIVENNAYNLIRIQDIPAETSRIIEINRSPSSKISRRAEDQFPYVRYIQRYVLDPLLDERQPPKDILIIGAGGFTMGLQDTHNHYTYVDIDPSLKDTAEKHFLGKSLTPNKQFVAASARAFVRGATSHYDLIILDTYTNMVSIPMETVTREFLQDTKNRLSPGGVLVANIIIDPIFRDKFSVRYDNTFASVFPAFNRIVVSGFNPWENTGDARQARQHMRNVLYTYVNGPLVEDTGVYTDDKNSYSLDR